jgi:hypothetical protein
MSNTGRCIDHLYIWSGWRTWPGGWCCSNGTCSWRGGSGIVREEREASIMPELTAAAHFDAVDLR